LKKVERVERVERVEGVEGFEGVATIKPHAVSRKPRTGYAARQKPRSDRQPGAASYILRFFSYQTS